MEGPEAPVDQEKVPGPEGETDAFNVVDSPSHIVTLLTVGVGTGETLTVEVAVACGHPETK
jgi:hypothetical protein